MKIELRKLLNNKMPQDSIKINIEYNTSQKEEVDNLIKYINRYSKSIFLEDNYIIEEVLYSDIVCLRPCTGDFAQSPETGPGSARSSNAA